MNPAFVYASPSSSYSTLSSKWPCTTSRRSSHRSTVPDTTRHQLCLGTGGGTIFTITSIFLLSPYLSLASPCTASISRYSPTLSLFFISARNASRASIELRWRVPARPYDTSITLNASRRRRWLASVFSVHEATENSDRPSPSPDARPSTCPSMKITPRQAFLHSLMSYQRICTSSTTRCAGRSKPHGCDAYEHFVSDSHESTV